MNLGLRTILLLVATVLFVISIFVSDQNFDEFLALGLAAFAFAFVTDALGWADRTFNTTTRRDDTP
jgi:H+/gluconate symporter-like permease